MGHEEIVRIVRGAKTAVLMVHGIAGTPRHFDALVPLVPKTMSLAVICLPGHGGSVRDFSRASMKAWKDETERWLRDLSVDHEQIFVVGHSMGTLLTTRLVKKYPAVRGMVLLNVPLKIKLAPAMAIRSLRFCFGTLRQDHPEEMALLKASGIRPEPWLWKYLSWLPRFWELFVLCRESRDLFEGMEIPCHVFQCEGDELVRSDSSKYLEGRKNVHHRVLTGCGHFYYTPEEFAKVLCCFEDLIHASE